MAMQQNLDSLELPKYIYKLINAFEKPLDYKLTRDIILISHRLKNGSDLWNMLIQQHLTINRFSAWNFCCLLHRLLRDGYYDIIRIAQEKYFELEYLRDYWITENRHMRHIGIPISKYFQLLLIKLKFHKVYTFFNGDLHMNRPQEWNLNVCFQLATDILEYMELILDLFAEIFNDIEEQKLSMKSCQAQCRLANVITLISECSTLYVHFITVQDVLTNMLPTADLIGINNRFYEMFGRMKKCFAYLNSLNWAFPIEFSLELPATAPVFNTEFLRREMPIPTAPQEREFY